MAPAVCASQWVLTSALTAALLGATLCLQPFPVCNTSCCTVLPSCSAALRVSCDCPGEIPMSLRKGDIPGKVLSLSIRHVKELVIHNDAIGELTLLTNFSLQNIGRVRIEGNGMTLSKDAKLRSVKFEDVRSLHIKSHAFSGSWGTRTRIEISRVNWLRVEPEAFAYKSPTMGPSLDIRQVERLHLQREGLMAPLYYLTLDNVTMDECHSKSFHGNINSVTLNKVAIDEIWDRCFSTLSTLSIRSSKLNTVNPKAFSGYIQEILIENTNFGSIQQRGFAIRTKNMQIVQSQISHLHKNGISVETENELTLKSVRIDHLSKSALTELKLLSSADSFAQSLELLKLDVGHAENGSLAFAKCAKPRVSELTLRTPFPRVCPTEKWVRQLTGADPTGPLDAAQHEILIELFGLCYEDTRISISDKLKLSSDCEAQTPESDDLLEQYDDKWYEYGYVADEGKDEEIRDNANWKKEQAGESSYKADESVSGSDGKAENAVTTVTLTEPVSQAISSTPEEKSSAGRIKHPDGVKEQERQSGGKHEEKRSPPHRASARMSTIPQAELQRAPNMEATEGPLAQGSPMGPVGDAEDSPTGPVDGTEGRAGDPDDETRSDSAAGLSSFLEEHQLLVFVMLGAVLLLAVALLVSLLALMQRRRRAREAKSPPAAAGALDLTADLPRTYGTERRCSAPDDGSVYAAGSSVYGHNYEQMDGHQYEQIRMPSPDAPRFPAPPPPVPPQPLYYRYQYGSSRSQGVEYESLLDR